MPRILIVEDEPAIADTLLYALKTEGFSPQWCATGGAGLEALAATEFALVILDIGLPDGSGIEFCKQIRARSAVPVLFLSARTGEIDRVLALELGGDDYVTKPFSPREITARVKAILRRTAAGPAAVVFAAPGVPDVPAALVATPAASAICTPALSPVSPASAAISRPETCNLIGYKSSGAEGEIVVDAERCAVTCRGVAVEVTRYEFRLLRTLAARPGRVFSRDELMSAAWEDPGASLDRTVDAHIKTLRAKLRAAAPEIDPIQTHRGIGYSFRMERAATADGGS